MGVFCLLPAALLTWRGVTTGIYSYLLHGTYLASISIFRSQQRTSLHSEKITTCISKCLKPPLRAKIVNSCFSLPCDWEWSSLQFVFPALYLLRLAKYAHACFTKLPQGNSVRSSTGTTALQSHNTLDKSCNIMESERLCRKHQILSENYIGFWLRDLYYLQST